MMQLPQICFFKKIPWVSIVTISMAFSSCAELDGVFPKFEPQKKIEEKNDLPTSTSVTKKQTLISEENRKLQKKINKLQDQIYDLQKKQKEQRDDLLLLQEQWEMNFVLLERSVEESLNSNKDSKFDWQIDSDLEKEKSSQKINKNKFNKNESLLPVENFSLLDNYKNEVEKKSLENKEAQENNNIDFDEGKIEVNEEPGFSEIGRVNLTDLEDSENLLDQGSDLILGRTDSSVFHDPSSSLEKDSRTSSFSDPDLNTPENPLILIRHPGVKKIYNQGMTALIQKNHLQAIRVFENFTKRFPDNIDSDNAFYWIGRSYYELNELEKAESAFRKVLILYEHRPTSQGYKTPDSIYMLGKLQFRKNLDHRARYYLGEVIRRYPGSAAARNAKRELNR